MGIRVLWVSVGMAMTLRVATGCPGTGPGGIHDDDASGDDDVADDDTGDDDTGDDDTGGDDDTAPVADVYGTLWTPTLEWSFDNPSVDGNPFDLVARVTFVHDDTGASHTTEMFYAGDTAWNVRFTGTVAGMWHWTSESVDAQLDGLSGSIWIDENPGTHGFVEARDHQWVRSGTEGPFVPQLVMLPGPHFFYGDWDWVDDVIQTYLVEHGFSGFHVPVFCRWCDLDHEACDEVASPDPDGRTFEALEILFRKTHAAGGMVHLWAWGDEQRGTTPALWGLNGEEDRRIQRYIAARLGPLPGWTLGYGYDLDEWTTEADLSAWHASMHQLFGWPHLLGGRSAGPNDGTDHADQQIYEGLDYSGYEHHRPDYDVYVAAVDARQDKPTFSEDRFRVRDTHEKDYTEEMTRRGLYHSTFAGGVANIWGYLLDDGTGGDPDQGFSHAYPHPEWIRTSAAFFADRFVLDMVRCNESADGICLRRADHGGYLIYAEDAGALWIDTSGMGADAPAVAVDTRLPYAEIDIGPLAAQAQTWSAPYVSDWALAIGTF